MNRLSINSYTLHEWMGVNREPRRMQSGTVISDDVVRWPARLDLLDVPKALAQRGIGAIDLCYNHFPSLDDDYLEKLSQAMADAGVRLFCLLVDFGHLTQPDSKAREAELAYISAWIRRAGHLNAQAVRVQAGPKSDLRQIGEDEQLEQIVKGYEQLAEVAESAGVRLMTENFGDFLAEADTILHILERLSPRLGLVVDYGNGRPPGEFDALSRLLPHAESIHAKPYIDSEGRFLEEDFITCVSMSEKAGFDAPYTIVYFGPHEPWVGIEKTRDIILNTVGRG